MAAEQEAREVDLTKEGGETEEQQPAVPLSLNLLSTIKTAQAQNGLRHGDYMRYRYAIGRRSSLGRAAEGDLFLRRKHCASKLQSLYKVLKMQHGRTKYVKRKLDVPNVTDVRCGVSLVGFLPVGQPAVPGTAGCTRWQRRACGVGGKYRSTGCSV